MSAYFEGADEFVFLDFETTGRDLLGRDYFDPAVPKHDATQIAIGWFDGVQLKSAHSYISCLLYTSPSPRDQRGSRMPSSA